MIQHISQWQPREKRYFNLTFMRTLILPPINIIILSSLKDVVVTKVLIT